ncbi:histone RNA hairpin-binding protein [Uranotaenia lowii]|uniref:histone RNA hairpin-binding protein n=1 Tax=Uranotaenia lowii TaxID=190385 RepID=UPI00247A11E0|nr:histone RNA hairpin-binding protein [Uranotaenia lowii]
MALVLDVQEDSRMSLSSDLSNLSPCKSSSSLSKITTPTKRTATLLTSTGETKDDGDVNKPDSKRIRQDGSSQSEHLQQSARRKTWCDMIQEDEGNAKLNSNDEETTLKTIQLGHSEELASSDSKMSVDENNSRDRFPDRKIEIDILESVNVEKFEKLVRDDKIKSPFKRRLSGEEDGEDGSADGHATRFSNDDEEDEDNCGAVSSGDNMHKKSKKHENDHGRERFRRESSGSSADGSSQSSRKPIEYEKDPAILERRQKQIDYGKNTLGYENYCREVPRDKRSKDHPKTPPKHIKYSRRAWDGLVKVWRKKLHCFDPDAKSKNGAENEDESDN